MEEISYNRRLPGSDLPQKVKETRVNPSKAAQKNNPTDPYHGHHLLPVTQNPQLNRIDNAAHKAINGVAAK